MSEPAALPTGVREHLLFQRPRKERLRQVTRIRIGMAMPSDERIHGMPVVLAQRRPGFARLRRVDIRRGQHERPPCGRQAARADKVGHGCDADYRRPLMTRCAEMTSYCSVTLTSVALLFSHLCS